MIMSDPASAASRSGPTVRRKNVVVAWIVAIFVWLIVWPVSSLVVSTLLTVVIVSLLGITANGVFYVYLALSHVVGMYVAYVVARKVWLTTTK
jgi:hypothetical protein